MKNVLIVVPCFNEEDGLDRLVHELNSSFKQKPGYKFDVFLINDGSTDDTEKAINKIASKNSNIYYRHLASNAGHQSALRAGIDVANKYDAVIMMDADLQHPPDKIKEMISSWEKTKANIVQMVRDDSPKDNGIIKYSTSKTYYWILNLISGLNMEYGSSDFRLIDNSVVKIIASSSEKDLFLRGYFSWLPVKRVNLSYRPNERFTGSSKYTFKKMFDLAKKGVLQFSEKPLKLAMNLGTVLAIASFLYGIYLTIAYLFGDITVSGWSSLMVVMLFCFGVNFILIGFIGRYLVHSISLQKARPEYIVASEHLPSK